MKLHQDAANPAGGQENQGLGRTKGGLNCKVTALVDARGRALQLAVAPGRRHDLIAAKPIIIPKGKESWQIKVTMGIAFGSGLGTRAARHASRLDPAAAILRPTPGAITAADIRWRISFSASNDADAWEHAMKNSM